MSRFHTVSQSLTLLTEGTEAVPFLPWGSGDQGARTYFKLERNGESVLLDGGAYPALPLVSHKNLMRLVNEGWAVQGEVHITFDGLQNGEDDLYLDTDAVTVQVGRNLLPLVDPQNGSPLLDKIRQIREELASDLGFVLPGVRVADNLALREFAYVVLLRQTPVAEGEVFLDKLLAVGTLDQLSSLQGWSTQEPAFRMTAKWIEAEQRTRAETAGCLVVGGLNVLMTHIQELLRQHASELLGLQDLHNLLSRLTLTHPIVVEEFLRDRRALRTLRRVLHELLMERVSMRNLITILEVVGDGMLDGLSLAPLVESVRRALARQILAGLSGDDGSIHGLLLSDDLERLLQDEQAPLEDIVRHVRSVWEEQGSPPAIFTQAATRRLIRALLSPVMPHVSVLSAADILPSFRVHVAATVSFPPAAPKPPDPPPPDKSPRGTMWKKKSR